VQARGLALLHPYLTIAEERNCAEFTISQLSPNIARLRTG
jgi:hypothetical protein